MGAKVGRNDACPCGSGRKYKQCCFAKSQRMSLSMRLALLAAAGMIIAGVTFAAFSFNSERNPTAGRVWSPEHGHWH
jgi:SEC-C motif